MDDEEELTQTKDDDDIDGLFDWAVTTFNSGGTDLTNYTATLDEGTLASVSDGTTTIIF